MKTLAQYITLACLAILMHSCTGTRYNVLNELGAQERSAMIAAEAKVPTISVGQELCITVTGLNEESAQYFRASKEREGATGVECLFYQVNENGMVDMPIIGEVNLQGMTLEQAEVELAQQIDHLIKDPAVRISFTDFHISMMGEVRIPSLYEFPNGRVTIYEAIARAGGLTDFAKRKSVLILRDTGKEIKHVRLDLTKEALWETEYYYLNSGDVVMIDSNAGRVANSHNVTTYGSVLVGLGTIAAIILSR